jgi:AcrR family transcriptional regulator
MSRSRRAELVDVGLELALAQRFQDWLATVDTRTIADAAGVTTGSFFHHFRNRAEFANAVAERFQELWAERVEHLVANSQLVSDEQADPDVVRSAARDEWGALTRPSATVQLQHLLWVARERAVADDASVAASDLLAEAYGALTDAVRPAYEQALEAAGREMLPPFRLDDLSVLMTAFAEGLQMRAAVDPSSVREDLYVDGVAAFYIGITRPRAERVGVVDRTDDLPTLEARMAQQRPNVLVDDVGSSETWRQIADAAAPLFSDRSPTDVRIAEVADVAGVSTSTVYHHFGSITAVAAAGFARFLPELAEISAQPLTVESGPLQRIEEVLSRYVELLKEHRGVAEALVTEVARETGIGRRERPRTLRAVMPLFELIHHHIRELRARGMLRRRIESERLARSLIQLVTVQTLAYADDPVERIVDETLTLVFDGALVVSTGS